MESEEKFQGPGWEENVMRARTSLDILPYLLDAKSFMLEAMEGNSDGTGRVTRFLNVTLPNIVCQLMNHSYVSIDEEEDIMSVLQLSLSMCIWAWDFPNVDFSALRNIHMWVLDPISAIYRGITTIEAPDELILENFINSGEWDILLEKAANQRSLATAKLLFDIIHMATFPVASEITKSLNAQL